MLAFWIVTNRWNWCQPQFDIVMRLDQRLQPSFSVHFGFLVVTVGGQVAQEGKLQRYCSPEIIHFALLMNFSFLLWLSKSNLSEHNYHLCQIGVWLLIKHSNCFSNRINTLHVTHFKWNACFEVSKRGREKKTDPETFCLH